VVSSPIPALQTQHLPLAGKQAHSSLRYGGISSTKNPDQAANFEVPPRRVTMAGVRSWPRSAAIACAYFFATTAKGCFDCGRWRSRFTRGRSRRTSGFGHQRTFRMCTLTGRSNTDIGHWRKPGVGLRLAELSPPGILRMTNLLRAGWQRCRFRASGLVSVASVRICGRAKCVWLIVTRFEYSVPHID
jgi:hypothetical protein